jgi:hypothetical protein
VLSASTNRSKFKEDGNLGIYDVYGFMVAVEGSADKVFSEEYGYFKISEVTQKIDLFVKVNEARRFLPTRTYGSPICLVKIFSSYCSFYCL